MNTPIGPWSGTTPRARSSAARIGSFGVVPWPATCPPTPVSTSVASCGLRVRQVDTDDGHPDVAVRRILDEGREHLLHVVIDVLVVAVDLDVFTVVHLVERRHDVRLRDERAITPEADAPHPLRIPLRDDGLPGVLVEDERDADQRADDH